MTPTGLAQLVSESYCEAHSHSRACETIKTSKHTQEQSGLQWTKLTHSTLIIGYG